MSKEISKRLSKLADKIYSEFAIDDDVVGGYLEEPHLSIVNEIYIIEHELTQQEKESQVKPSIENLKAKMRGFELNIHQEADALIEFNKLVQFVESVTNQASTQEEGVKLGAYAREIDLEEESERLAEDLKKAIQEQQPTKEEEKCKFNLAWVGDCGKKANNDGFCEEHKDIKCSVCGERATRQCPVALQFVCGFPLCDKCQHNH